MINTAAVAFVLSTAFVSGFKPWMKMQVIETRRSTEVRLKAVQESQQQLRKSLGKTVVFAIRAQVALDHKAAADARKAQEAIEKAKKEAEAKKAAEVVRNRYRL